MTVQIISADGIAGNRFVLSYCNLLVPGINTGDPLKVAINWQFQCTGALCYGGWRTVITSSLAESSGYAYAAGIDPAKAITNADGHNLAKRISLTSTGGWGGQISILEFNGAMPPHDINLHLVIWNALIVGGVEGTILDFNIQNTSIVPTPPGPEPGYCIEGDEKCVGLDRMICRNAIWTVKEKNSIQCGYIPPVCVEGTTRCYGTSLQRCTSGGWKTEKINATECGYVPPVPTTCSVDADCPENEVCTGGKCVCAEGYVRNESGICVKKGAFPWQWVAIAGAAIAGVILLIPRPKKAKEK